MKKLSNDTFFHSKRGVGSKDHNLSEIWQSDDQFGYNFSIQVKIIHDSTEMNTLIEMPILN